MRIRNTIWLIVFIGLGCLLSGCSETEAEKHFRQGHEYYSQGEYKQAIAEYQKVIEIDPNNLLGLFLLGACYKLQGELDDAITKYQQTLRIDPNYAVAHIGLGSIYYKQGKYEQAIAKCLHVISLPPDPMFGILPIANAHLSLGYIYRKQGKLNNAIAELRQAMKTEVNPDVEPAWTNQCQGGIYLTQGQLDDAISEYQQVVKVNPKGVYAHYNLACVYSLKNEPQLAIGSLQKAIDLDKSYIESSKTDPDFDNIRQTPEFQQLINSD